VLATGVVLIGLPAVAVGLLGAALVGVARRKPTRESDPEADPRDPLHRQAPTWST
jgi:hypothetical protein